MRHAWVLTIALSSCGSPGPGNPTRPAEPASESPTTPAPAPAESPVAQPANETDPAKPEVCLADPPPVPPDLPRAARECFDDLLRARASAELFVRPEGDAPPCAREELDTSGGLVANFVVEEFSPRLRKLKASVTDPDVPDERTVYLLTERFDDQGRLVSIEDEDQQHLDASGEPDCVNTADTEIQRDSRGWPTKTVRKLDSCEGVDAGTIVTRRKFSPGDEHVSAALSIRDRGSAETGREWFVPDPASPVARITCRGDDCDCQVSIRSCEGAELGLAVRWAGLSVHRWRWNCSR